MPGSRRPPDHSIKLQQNRVLHRTSKVVLLTEEDEITRQSGTVVGSLHKVCSLALLTLYVINALRYYSLHD